MSDPQYYPKVFKARSVATPKDNLPIGTKKSFYDIHNKAPVSEKHEVWLCEDQVGKSKPTKLKKLHEAIGATSRSVCDHFCSIWTPDSQELAPPQCPADGKSIKPTLDQEVQPCLAL